MLIGCNSVCTFILNERFHLLRVEYAPFYTVALGHTNESTYFNYLYSFFVSCNQNRNDYKNDSINITEKQFSKIDPQEIRKLTLVRHDYIDSLTFIYIKTDTSNGVKYTYNKKTGEFKNARTKYICVDTFNIKLLTDSITCYKYEVELPPMDGDGCIIFTKRYGNIAYSSYSWNSQGILTNWGSTDIEKELYNAFIDTENRYLKRQNLIAPPDTLLELEDIQGIEKEIEIGI